MTRLESLRSFHNVTETAEAIGYDFEVWLCDRLYAWCRQSGSRAMPSGREIGLLSSVGYLIEAYGSPKGRFRVKAAGEELCVDFVCLPRNDRIPRFVVTFAHELDNKVALPHAQLTSASDKHLGHSLDETRSYFVCEICDAKWFAPPRSMACPRCGNDAISSDRQIPPWRARRSHREGG